MNGLLKTIGADGGEPGASNFGRNRFADADDKNPIGSTEDAPMDFDEVGSEMVKMLKGEAMNLFNGAKKALTPAFITRYQNKKIHVQRIANTDMSLQYLSEDAKQTITDEYEQYLKDKKRQEILEARLEKQRIHDEETKKTLTKAVEQQRFDNDDDYKRRRQLQLEEVQAKIDLELRLKMEKEERELKELREWRHAHWSTKSKEYHEEALQADTMLRKQQFEQSNTVINKTYNEWTDRQLSQARQQVEGPTLSTPTLLPSGSSLGVFGVPMGPGEYHGLFEDAGYQDGLDNRNASAFGEPAPQTEYESAVVAHSDVEGEIGRKQLLLDALQTTAKQLEDDMEHMADLRQVAQIDFVQVEQELMETEKDQSGPPRRLPIAPEMLPTHQRKERLGALRRKMEDIQHALSVAVDQREAADRQMALLSADIAALKEQAAQLQDGPSLGGYNRGFGSALPMVIGRSLTKIAGLEQLGQPKAIQDAVTHKSRWVGMYDQSRVALKVHKERTALDQELWVARQGTTEMKEDADRIYTRMMEISRKLKTASLDDARLNLLDALNGFLSRKVPLNRVKKKICGQIPWFTYLEEELSSDVDRFACSNPLGSISYEISAVAEAEMDSRDPLANGITLGDGAKSGYCCGLMTLPKDALWSVSFTVMAQANPSQQPTKQPPKIPSEMKGNSENTESKESNEVDEVDEFFNPHEDDFVSVRIGPTIGSASVVGTFYNKVNPDSGSVLYDVKYVFRGKTLGYRFDFSSAMEDRKRHLAVCTGLFEEFEMKPVEIIPDPDKPNREKIISSFVKTIRAEELQNKNRATDMLVELINAEDSKKATWDSELINNYPQRYAREFFLRILRAEILIDIHQRNKDLQRQREDHARAMAMSLKHRFLSSKNRRKNNNGDIKLSPEERMQASADQFIARKRATQVVDISEGQAKVGRLIELYNPESMTWRHCIIMECKLVWVDNGTKAKITYVLQEFTDVRDPVGGLFEIALEDHRYYESPARPIDAEAINQLREQRKWEARLQEINDDAQKRIKAMEEIYDKFCQREQLAFEKEKKRKMAYIRKQLPEDAQAKARQPGSRRVIQGMVTRVLRDMRRGIVGIDPKQKPRPQAEVIARQRFVDEFVEAKTREIELTLETKAELMMERFAQRLDDLKDYKERVLQESRVERYRLEWYLREKRLADIAAVKKRVSFNPERFKLALPTSQLCEHVRAKAWGDSYGKGVRCVACGKEVSESHHDPSQYLGYGSGCAPWLHEAVQRHRANEQAFRFKNAQELVLVERERVRLEKEARCMEESEVFFYDFDDLQVIYDFDQRHAKHLKGFGMFRQGLQWTASELETYEQRLVGEEKARVAALGLSEVHTMVKFDALKDIKDPLPTYRALEARHRTAYNELMTAMGRLHTYQKKILQLKDIRVNLMSDRVLYSRVLESLHKDSFVFEIELSSLESDLDKTAKLLSTYEALQALWRNASRILSQAQRDKKKAEMRQVGLVEDIVSKKDALAFLHDETRQLLKLKYLYETKVEKTVRATVERRELVQKTRLEWVSAEDAAAAVQYCRPGAWVHTRYGPARIVTYRHHDHMVMATLTFGTPPAKVWLHAFREIIDPQRSLARSEVLLMEKEDESMQKFLAHERNVVRRERALMSKEEAGLRQYYEFVDLSKEEDSAALAAVNNTVVERFSVSKTDKYQLIQGKTVEKRVQAFVKAREQEIKDYKGPVVGKPKPLKGWQIKQKQREVMVELTQKYILQGTLKAEAYVKTDLHNKRVAWLQSYTFQSLIDGVITGMVSEVAQEAYNEGRVAKYSAERHSGLYFPNPAWMQFATYNALTKLWKQRKEALTLKMEMTAGLAAKMESEANPTKKELSDEEIMRIKQARRKRKAEKRRQRRMCIEMAKEEAANRVFYQWELKENLRDRREMREEDSAAKALRKQELEMKKAAASAYAVSASLAQGSAQATQVTDFERRRNELKELTIERGKRDEEQALMTLEDKAGELLREVDRLERQKQQFLKEFGTVSDDEDEEEEEEVGANNGGGGRQKAPVWMSKPRLWDEWNNAQKRTYIQFMAKMRMRQKTIERKAKRESKLLRKIEDKGYRAWQEISSFLSQKEVRLELQLMQDEEDLKGADAEVIYLNDNIRKLAIFCREKGEEELQAVSDIKRCEENSRKRDRELEEATAWLALCDRRAKNREKLKRKITEDCKWVDSESISGFLQRFKTELLRERLYWDYFRKIVASVINRAESIATERRLMGVQELLSFNRDYIKDRVAGMKRQWHAFQREEYLRMRRSFLNQRFFPKYRRQVLQERFLGWLRYYLWNRGHREAFEMKYEVIKRQLDIDRQFRKQLHNNSSSNSNNSLANKTRENHQKGTTTVMRKHQERPMQCRMCRLFYLEAQNQSMACVFHPEKYALGCPKTCPNPGLTALCIAHRMRRWPCCDATSEGAMGCGRRYHIPVESDPVYDSIMEKINERDAAFMQDIHTRHAKAVKDNWPGKLAMMKVEQVREVEDKLQAQRDTAERFHSLKFH